MALKIGEEVNVDGAPKIVSAAGYTCDCCDNFRLVLFDETDNAVACFDQSDGQWRDLITYIEGALREKFRQ